MPTPAVGYFSDIHYDAKRKHWWGLSDRGPGGGALDYDTRVQRFASNRPQHRRDQRFPHPADRDLPRRDGLPARRALAEPAEHARQGLRSGGLRGAPEDRTILVSDEYGPSLYEFDREGFLLHRFETPANLVPRNSSTGTPSFAGDPSENAAGKRTNRGFEGLAIGPDGAHVYAMLQSAMLDEGGGSGVCARIVKFDADTGRRWRSTPTRWRARRRGAAPRRWLP